MVIVEKQLSYLQSFAEIFHRICVIVLLVVCSPYVVVHDSHIRMFLTKGVHQYAQGIIVVFYGFGIFALSTIDTAYVAVTTRHNRMLLAINPFPFLKSYAKIF